MPFDVGNYFPVSIGNVWEARITTAETGQPTTSYTSAIRITGNKLIKGVQALVFQESDPSRGILGEDYRTKTSAGINYYGNNDTSDTITQPITPYLEFVFPLQAGSIFEQVNRGGLDYGQDLDGDGIHEIFSFRSTVTLVGLETVTVTREPLAIVQNFKSR